MARTTKKKETSVPVVTRAEKKDATKALIRETLQKKSYKHNDLIDETAKLYTERFGGEETDNINDVKGRVGSVLDIMKKDGDVLFEGGMYALKGVKDEKKTESVAVETMEEKPKKATRSKTKKTTETAEKTPVIEETPRKAKTVKKAEKELKAETEKKTAKTAKKTVKAKKTEEVATEVVAKESEKDKNAPLPAEPLLPIAPVAPSTPKVAPEPIPAEAEPKKRGRKPKAVEKAAEKETPEVKTEPAAVAAEITKKTEVKAEEKASETAVETPTVEEVKAEVKAEETPIVKEDKAEEKTPVTAIVEKKKAEIAPKSVMDMSFLFGDVKPAKKEEKTEKPVEKAEKTEEKPAAKVEEKPAVKAIEKPAVKTVEKAEQKTGQKIERKSEPPKKPVKEPINERRRVVERPTNRALTADEKLRDAFLKRIRALGGDYFEYYSIYLLERYSMRNGRRLEGLRVTAGDHDGGIDGEIELTDKFGFKETIYIQSKNWDPDKGDEKLWVVGETLLQQFIGACMCRQAKDGKQHCRGIFITTSRFTPEAKRLLDTMSDKIVGYDGNDLYETAKECSFGLVQINGEWKLDEKLLSGAKAFFQLY
ncbi:MAG: restriction endonuclease [Clostridia bacterium]|nr:restriction endonuclease [Clostridia bacterium]